MAGTFLLTVVVVCYCYVFYDLMEKGNYWNKIPFKIAVFICGALYLLSSLTFYDFFSNDRLSMLTIPTLIFTIASILLVGILRGKFE